MFLSCESTFAQQCYDPYYGYYECNNNYSSYPDEGASIVTGVALGFLIGGFASDYNHDGHGHHDHGNNGNNGNHGNHGNNENYENHGNNGNHGNHGNHGNNGNHGNGNHH